MSERIENIRAAARNYFGGGKQAEAFVLGGTWSDDHPVHAQINNLARSAFNNAIIRGKTSKTLSHDESFFGIFEEFKELKEASEYTESEHIPGYTETAEELADILICCLTELHKRGVNVEKIITDKINFNNTRL